jgi:hypothetical protein
MIMHRHGFVIALLLALPGFLAAQTNSSENIFTISVAAPTSPQDVQVRYFLNGDPAVQQSSSIAKPDDGKILVKTGVDGRPARSFRAIVYSPGCQFVTIREDDLSASTRQGEFQCQKLSTTPLRGKAEITKFAGRDLQVQALYACNWAGQFFGMPGLAISPLSVASAHVESNGSFTMELPDFSGDPLWASLSHNATLMFLLTDATTGEHLARLSAPRDLSRGGSLKVAPGYPAEIQFGIRSQSPPKPAKSSN